MAPTRSKMWKYFEKREANIAVCKFCFKEIKTSGNTSNVAKHMKLHKNIHQPEERDSAAKSTVVVDPELLDRDAEVESESATSTPSSNCLSQLQPSTSSASQSVCSPGLKKKLKGPIERAFHKISSFEIGGNRHSQITNALIYFICKDNRPFYTVQREGFRRLMRELAPLYKIPGMETIKNKIDKKYHVLSEIYKGKLSNIPFVSVTCDVWSEMMSCRSFLGVTLHFLEDNALSSVCIEVHELTDRHTADYIGTQLQQLLLKWNINSEKVIAIVTDNGANMVSAVNKYFGKDKRISCFAHLINLIADKVLQNEAFTSLLKKVRNIVKLSKSSVNVSDNIRKIQLEKGIAEGKIKKLILDVKTRWNSVYYMLQRFLEMAEIISQMLSNRPDAPPMLTAVEILQIKEIVRLLKPLEFVTTDASGEKYVTISKIIPLINCVKSKLSAIRVELEPGKILKSELEKQILKRFGNIEYVSQIAIATLLDPRFKNIHFQELTALAEAQITLRRLIQKEVADEDQIAETEQMDTENADDFDFWTHHQDLVNTNKHKKNTSQDSHDELKMYLNHPLAPLKSDPITEWENMKTLFPMLYSQARKSLSVIATSVPSERLFSKAGMTVNESRNRLLGKRLTKLIFLSTIKEKEWF